MPETVELDVVSGDVLLSASLTLPTSVRVRGRLVPLHPARDASREQFLFRHLAEILPPLGLAVLRYDRRKARRQAVIDCLQCQARRAPLRDPREKLS